ncbi:MAG: vanadium-dependent haloperoxidase [Saprospiraceae bacterium]|nr:vanadium-dependent haloperoxidase [Saprospiraceae bacterium]
MKNWYFADSIVNQTSLKKAACRLLAVFALASMLTTQNCSYDVVAEPLEYRSATEVALSWNRLALNLERHTLGYRPPVSARMYAYIEMSAYEASLPGLQDYLSLETYLSGYKRPNVAFGDGQFNLPASLNAAYAQILRQFFPTAPDNLRQQIELLEKRNAQIFLKKTTATGTEESAVFGKTVANTVWAWSKTDREGHEGHLYNYDHGYVPPVCTGCWQPTGEHPSPALLPYWGRVRSFIVDSNDIRYKHPLDYEETPGSGFYTEAMEVYSLSKPLSRENQWIAEFWSDDLPGLTLSPSGRWISITNQALEKARPPFPLLIETYLKTALALCDAGIIVWKGKYTFNIERPETYIRAQINPDWKALHDTPSFPAYPSGHAAFGAAAAEVLTDALGRKFQLTDRTHEKRPEFASTPRSYGSFTEMAQENAASRVLLGVHYRMDCEEGVRLGKIIGQKLVNLPLKRKEAAVLKR